MKNIPESLKARVYDVLDMNSELSWSFFERARYRVKGIDEDDKISWFNQFIIVLIFLNVIAFILGTFDPIATEYGAFLNTFEVVSVIIFTLEYGLRVWSCSLNPQYRGVVGHLKYMVSFFAIIDLLSFLPFYFQLSAISIPFLIPDGRFFRTLRLIRVIKIFKYSNSMISLKNVIIAKKDDLILTFIIGLFLLFISSSFMYYFEHDAQRENFGNLFDAMYWGIVPLTTVGYGDVLPVTTEGKLISSIITVICITMLALPTGIISEGFIEEKKRMREESRYNGSETKAIDVDLQHKMLKPDNFSCDGSSHESLIPSRCPYCNNYIDISINKKAK